MTDGANAHVQLFFELRAFVMDGATHKYPWHCKGDAGLKPCMLCLNLYTRQSGVAQEGGTRLLVCDAIDEGGLKIATDAQVRGTVNRLAVRSTTDEPSLFKKRETAVGFRHEPYSLLLMPELADVVRPVSQFCHDPQHTIFVNGVFNTVLYLVLESLHVNGMRVYEAVRKFLEGWSWPSRVWNPGLAAVFSPVRVKSWRKSHRVACTASEGLSLLSPLMYFVHIHVLPTGRCVNACHAFLALGEVVDCLQNIPAGRTSASSLSTSISQFLRLVKRAGWEDWCHPKFHWMVHLPSHLRKFGCIPTCWSLERKHRCAKRYANDVRDTRRFDHSVLSEVTCHHLALLDHAELACPLGLISPHAAPQRLRQFLSGEFDILDDIPILCSKKARFQNPTSCMRRTSCCSKRMDRWVLGKCGFWQL